MKNAIKFGIMGFFALLMAATSCGKQTEDPAKKLIAGHYGCEQYVSCRDNDDGTQRWDTARYDVGPGCEYEIYFNDDGSGLLLLNNSPALIKRFTCTFDYDTVNQVISIVSDSWLYAIYGSLFLDENHVEFKVDELTGSTLVASWTNKVSEDQPFFERFFLKQF